MLSKDFEIYYYNDAQFSGVQNHTRDYYEFYFFLEGLCVNDLILHLNRTIYELEHPQNLRDDQNLCESLILYIERHLDEELSLDSLAQYFYLSKFYISHIFKETLGVSVHQFITRKRLSM